jgi:hypothetical protein
MGDSGSAVSVQHGEEDIMQVARHVLGLAKLNYSACQPGDSQTDHSQVFGSSGEMRLANPELAPTEWRHDFKCYN